MDILSKRVKSMKPSATLALVQKAAELKKAGKDVISLSVGEPDFNTPDFICAAAKKAIDNGQTKYTPVPGTAELRQAIVDKFKKDNGLDYSVNEVMASTGGKQVLFNALLASVDSGDEVIIPAPFWVSYPEMVAFADGAPVIVDCPEADEFKLTAASLENAITPKTKWLILNSPSNPTGMAYSKAELEAIADVLRKHPHVHVISDDIYEHLVYGDFKFHTLAQVAPDLKGRTIIVNGVSKSHAMTGWRLGYAAGPETIIKAMSKIQGQSTSNPSSVTQAAAVEALKGDQSFLKKWRKEFQARQELVYKRLNAINGMKCIKPQGAFYLYASCEGFIGSTTPDGDVIKDDQGFANYILNTQYLTLVPGSAFGMSPYFRISYALSQADLEKACQRLEKACSELKLSNTPNVKKTGSGPRR